MNSLQSLVYYGLIIGVCLYLFIRFGIPMVNYLRNYFKEYKVELKEAWKGKKEPGNLEIVSIDKTKIKKILFSFLAAGLTTVVWIWFNWKFAITFFVIFYFGIGLILINRGVIDG